MFRFRLHDYKLNNMFSQMKRGFIILRRLALMLGFIPREIHVLGLDKFFNDALKSFHDCVDEENSEEKN